MTAHITKARAALSPPTPRTRTVAMLAAAALGLSLLPTQAASADTPQARDVDNVCSGVEESDFNDIEGNTHEDVIECMAHWGLAEGVGDGSSYAPRRAVTREQMATFIVRFLESYTDQDLDEGDDERFDDVAESDFHAASINKLAHIEVVGGTGESQGQEYAPGSDITRGQMAALIRRSLSWLDDGDASNDTAPQDSEESGFDDTVDTTHEAHISALAGEGIVTGYADGDYRPNTIVTRDQMAAFIMRGYDYAVEAELGDDTPPGDGIGIVDPTEEQPLFPVAPGDEIDITFTTDRDGDYTLDFRDPAPGADDGFFLPFPGGDEDEGPGPWTDFDGAEASGTVEADTHTVSVTLPSDEEDVGVRDLRLQFTYDDGDRSVTHVESAALVVSDGVVINTDQDLLEFSLQEAVDSAEDGDTLFAIGAFDELVEITGVSDLTIGAAEGTTLAGSFTIDDADGLGISELTITDYETFSDLDDVPIFGDIFGPFVGDPIAILASDSEDVSLSGLTLTGDDDAIGVLLEGVEGEILGSTFEDHETGIFVGAGSDLEVSGGNVFRDNTTGVDVRASGTTVTGNAFEANTTGVIVFGGMSTVSGNSFDDHGNVAVDLIAQDTDVEDNVFGAADAEHVCYPEGFYSSENLVADNEFELADTELRTRDEADDRRCLGPVPQDEDEDDNGDDS